MVVSNDTAACSHSCDTGSVVLPRVAAIVHNSWLRPALPCLKDSVGLPGKGIVFHVHLLQPPLEIAQCIEDLSP